MIYVYRCDNGYIFLHYIDKKPITNNGEPIVIGKQTTIKLKLVPQKEDNGAEYQ